MVWLEWQELNIRPGPGFTVRQASSFLHYYVFLEASTTELTPLSTTSELQHQEFRRVQTCVWKHVN